MNGRDNLLGCDVLRRNPACTDNDVRVGRFVHNFDRRIRGQHRFQSDASDRGSGVDIDSDHLTRPLALPGTFGNCDREFNQTPSPQDFGHNFLPYRLAAEDFLDVFRPLRGAPSQFD